MTVDPLGKLTRLPDSEPTSVLVWKSDVALDQTGFLLRQTMVTLDRIRLAVQEMAGAAKVMETIEAVAHLRVILDECDRAIAEHTDISKIWTTDFTGRPSTDSRFRPFPWGGGSFTKK